MSPQPPRIGDINLLFAPFRDRILAGLAIARQRGLSVGVFETWRTPERQAQVKAAGTSHADPMLSWHAYGLACDIVFDASPANPGHAWTWNGPWLELAECMKTQGLEWGGDWASLKDRAHFQMTMGLTIREAHHLYTDCGGLMAVWAEVSRRIQMSPVPRFPDQEIAVMSTASAEEKAL